MAVTGLGTMREELQMTSVDALFKRGEAERLLSRPKAQEELEKITKSERGDHRLRVLAHELLLMIEGKKPDQKMVRIYCEALPGAFMHNWWGLPGEHLGRLGDTLLRFGPSTIPFLLKEMDDPALLTYLGPEAAKSREARYCVGDLAAYLASTILGRPYVVSADPDVRMAARTKLMDELTEILANEKNEKRK